MTPKFDNLASLLMEMPAPRIPDEKRLEIATYIEQFPDDSYEKIADAFGVSERTVAIIANELDVQRGTGGSAGSRHASQLRLRAMAGKETHINRKLTDVQEKQLLDHWLGNYHEMTFVDLAKWVNQQFNIGVSISGVKEIVKRAAAKHNKRLPVLPSGRKPMKGTASKHRNEPGTGKLPTQGSQHFSGSTDIVPSNPKHGGPAHPPK